jgi:hypothetical protein
MLGKLSMAVAAILMMPTALSAQVGGANIQGAVSQGIPTPADLSASSSAYYRSQKHSAAPQKKLKRSDAQKRYIQMQTQTPSLDGRVTGRSRTCGFATLQYDGLGVPYGPYCH